MDRASPGFQRMADSRKVPSPLAKLGHGKDLAQSKWNTTSTKGSSKRGQSVPVDISQRTDPEEKGLDWHTLDAIEHQPRLLVPEFSIFHAQWRRVTSCHQSSRSIYIQLDPSNAVS